MTTNDQDRAPLSSDGKVSLVVPIWREDAAFAGLIGEIAAWPEIREVIVAAADTDPAGLKAMQAAGARCFSTEQPGRGGQLNLGARHATGEWLLFHHADTDLTRAHVQALAALTPASGIVGGAFYRKFDQRHPSCGWMEPIERWHNRTFGALYGDQSLFTRRSHFETLGGFADIPLMEDVEFSRRLRASGRIALLDPPIASSPRKHLANGAWRTTFQNASILLLYSLGVNPRRLHSWYYGARPATFNPTQIQQHHENQTHIPADGTVAATDAPR